MKVTVWNKENGKQLPNQLLYCFITYDMKGNMIPVDEKYELRFEINKESLNNIKYEGETLKDYIDNLQEQIDKYEDNFGDMT